MSQSNVNLTVLGLDVAFRPGADMERVQRAITLVEEQFAAQQSRSRGGQSRETLLTFLALGLADDLLQSKKKLVDVQNRISTMLLRIDESR